MTVNYKDMTAKFTYKKAIVWGDLYDMAANDAWLEQNGWEDGTKAIFFQAAAPTGWTQVAQNDKIFRVTSGAGGGTGGTLGTNTNFTLAHRHSFASDPNHLHALENHHHELSHANRASTGGIDSTRFVSETGSYLSAGPTVSGDKSFFYSGGNYHAGSFSGGNSSSAGEHDHGLGTESVGTDTKFQYVDVIVCSKNAAGAGYTDLTAYFTHNLKIDFEPWETLADNDNFNYAQLTPATTISIFYQNIAPTGWTRVNNQNDKLLRVVSGGGSGTGGTTALSDGLSSNHSHDVIAGGDHNHSLPNHTHSLPEYSPGSYTIQTPYPSFMAISTDGTYLTAHIVADGGSADNYYTKNSSNVGAAYSSGDSGTHDHEVSTGLSGLNYIPYYVDVIQCSKNAAGAPFAFANVTGTILYKKLVSKQKLTAYAQNDAHIKFHVVEQGSKAFFFQAFAPQRWTRLTDVNDYTLRIVSGAGGETGGNTGIGTGFPLSHTHAINAEPDHRHTMPDHTHSLVTQSVSRPKVSTAGFICDNGSFLLVYAPTSGAVTQKVFKPGFEGGSIDDSGNPVVYLGWQGATHDHGGLTASGLTNISMAYVDVIQCQKN